MRVLTGIDIIEIERIKQSIDNLENRFINEIFTPKEIEYCESKRKARYQHYAARFAAKEAVFKAISGQLKDKYSVTWKDFEVENDVNGRPKINIYNIDNSNIENIDISISHCKSYATANVVILYK